jgi:hypothetical protein
MALAVQLLDAIARYLPALANLHARGAIRSLLQRVFAAHLFANVPDP